MSDRLAIPEGDRLNYSDAWLRSTAAALEVSAIDATAPRRIYLDAACEIFALVSPEDYAFASQWRWGWVWDRTKTKRYARRTPSRRRRRAAYSLAAQRDLRARERRGAV